MIIEIFKSEEWNDYFLFSPVVFYNRSEIETGWNDHIRQDDYFYIWESVIDYFLYPFLLKYFDENLLYNRKRHNYQGFERWSEPNYYTYESLKRMTDEINETADLLENDFDNPVLDDLKEHIKDGCNYYANGEYKSGEAAELKNTVHVAIDFYRRFTESLNQMMSNNTNTDIITIEGP